MDLVFHLDSAVEVFLDLNKSGLHDDYPQKLFAQIDSALKKCEERYFVQCITACGDPNYHIIGSSFENFTAFERITMCDECSQENYYLEPYLREQVLEERLNKKESPYLLLTRKMYHMAIHNNLGPRREYRRFKRK